MNRRFFLSMFGISPLAAVPAGAQERPPATNFTVGAEAANEGTYSCVFGREAMRPASAKDAQRWGREIEAAMVRLNDARQRRRIRA